MLSDGEDTVLDGSAERSGPCSDSEKKATSIVLARKETGALRRPCVVTLSPIVPGLKLQAYHSVHASLAVYPRHQAPFARSLSSKLPTDLRRP